MNSILDDLLQRLPARTVPVRRVFVGAHWTVVCSRYAGMAATLMADAPHGGMQVRDAGRLHEKPAQELARFARSSDPTEASIGVAALNSLLELDESRSRELNAADFLLQRGKGKRVALIGHFPFIERIREGLGTLWVIEQSPLEGEYPADSAADLLPRADVVAITGSTIANHTLDGLLALCSPSALVMVLGPSTPLSPVLFDHGAHVLSGTRIIDEHAALRSIEQGASLRQLEGVRLLTLMKDAAD